MLERTAKKPWLVGRDMSDEWRKPRCMLVPEGTALQGVPRSDTGRYSRRSQASVRDRAVVQNSEWVGKVLKRYVPAEAGGLEVTQGPPYLDVPSSSH